MCCTFSQIVSYHDASLVRVHMFPFYEEALVVTLLLEELLNSHNHLCRFWEG